MTGEHPKPVEALTEKEESSDPRAWMRELLDAGWQQIHSTLWQAPCGCYFRGPWRAWKEMRGTHLADHIAARLTT